MSLDSVFLLAADPDPRGQTHVGTARLSGPSVRVRVGHVHRIVGDSERFAAAHTPLMSLTTPFRPSPWWGRSALAGKMETTFTTISARWRWPRR